jgi:hypothetical protein
MISFVSPEIPEGEELRQASADELDALDRELGETERKVRDLMRPFEEQLKEIQTQRNVLATERRRRERAQVSARRKQVQAAAASGELPALLDALETLDLPDDLQLSEAKGFLKTGGQVGFGFATRPGSIAFTDGREVQNAKTWGDARRLYLDGWEPGTTSVSGVRVHLAGTKVERVVPASDVTIEP